MKPDRRQQIIEAAMQVFARKGFRGTTTRDLAAHADVNEAIIFRYFKNKEELYRAIIEHKAGEQRNARMEELERIASANDDEKFFEAVGRTFLERHEADQWLAEGRGQNQELLTASARDPWPDTIHPSRRKA